MEDEKQAVPLPENRVAQKKRHARRGSGSVFMPKGSRTWYIAYTAAPGRQITESARTASKQAAQELLTQRLEAVHAGSTAPNRVARLTIADLANDVLLDYRTKGYATLADVEIRVRCHLAPFFGASHEKDPATGVTRFVGGVKATTVSNSDAQRYIVMRREQGAKDATVANELSLLRRMFHLAVKNGKLRHAPYIGLPSNYDRPREGFIEAHQYRELLRSLPPQLRALVSLAFQTGMRRGELVGLTWEQVDFEHRFIRLSAEQTKTRSARQVPIPVEPFEMLRTQRQLRDATDETCELVFFRKRRRNVDGTGSPLVGLGDFEKLWQAACVAAGLGAWEDLERKKRYKGLLFHDLRRSAVRNMVRGGVPELVAMRVSGHRTRSVFDRYNIVSEADLTAAAKKITDHVSAAGRVEQPRQDAAGQRPQPQLVN